MPSPMQPRGCARSTPASFSRPRPDPIAPCASRAPARASNSRPHRPTGACARRACECAPPRAGAGHVPPLWRRREEARRRADGVAVRVRDGRAHRFGRVDGGVDAPREGPGPRRSAPPADVGEGHLARRPGAWKRPTARRAGVGSGRAPCASGERPGPNPALAGASISHAWICHTVHWIISLSSLRQPNRIEASWHMWELTATAVRS